MPSHLTRASAATCFPVALALASCHGLGPRPATPIAFVPQVERRVVGDTLEEVTLDDRGPIDFANLPTDDLVQLHVRTSWFGGGLALHPWFVVFDREQGRFEQWEIWAGDLTGRYVRENTEQRVFSDGRSPEPFTFRWQQYGTVRSWIGLSYMSDGSFDRVLGEWSGEQARAIAAVLRRPEDYPHVDQYRLWPGPNSNTYARWVLAESGVALDLDPQMVGKDWQGWFGVDVAPARTGLSLAVLQVGATVGLREGVELDLLGATLGVDVWPPALKTPFGRFGFAE
jgi:hypothetical protein